MVSLFLLAGAMLAAAPADEVKVDVGKGNFATMPALKVRTDLPSPAMIGMVERILGSGACKMQGQSVRRFDITVPYAVELLPDGTTRHVIVADTGCPALETMVGEVVLKLATTGDFRENRADSPKWFASEINFTQQ
jgi:hypothetical protein